MSDLVGVSQQPDPGDQPLVAAEQRYPNSRAYSGKQLHDDLPPLQLSTDYPRRALQTFRAAMQPLVMPKSLTEAVEGLSQREGVTLFATLLASFEALLYRYSGQEEVALGSILTRHQCSETENPIGSFVRTVVLSTNLSGNPSFIEVTKQAQEITLGACLSLAKLSTEELQSDRDLRHGLPPQVLFSLRSQMLEPASDWTGNGAAKYDLCVELEYGPEGIVGRFNYNADLFNAGTIAQMAGDWWTLLEGAVADPGRQISELPLLTEAEQHKVLVEFNDTAANWRRDLCVHDFFEAQVQRGPTEIALVCENERLTYGELDARANRVAHYLRKCGVGPEVLVGICTGRSGDMLVGILGILKAGGAYVPLDPTHPKDRLAAILKDSKASILLTQQSLLNSLPPHAAKVIRLDADWPKIAAESQENPVSNVKPENLAYVLFTSGSTGRPKGVELEHRSAASFIQWAQCVFAPEEVGGTLFSTSICFDLSVFEIFVPLSIGGKVIMVQNALFLPELPAANEVTLINTVPSAMAELVRMNAVPASVQVINLAGEALPASLAQQIYAKTAVRKVYNLYGPTEDTTYSTGTLVPRGADVTIGRPLLNRQAYVLDANRRPMPIGVPGELYLAGDGLARGYFGRPDLTNERFLPNPFSQEPGGRMYRTGDLARFLSDGNIEYLGRLDQQVKVRGFRIESGEIETVLNQYPAVSQSVLMAREDKPGDKRLVAYVVPAQSPAPTTTELRAFLRRYLPEYMLPSAFVTLECMPLTTNGKLDRRALPIPEHADISQQEEHEAARDPVESQLVKIWEAVLGARPVGIRDNFFELGGHSLLVPKLLHRVEQDFGKKLPMATLYHAPTVDQLAAILRNDVSPPRLMAVVPIQPLGSKTPFFMVGARHIFRPLARHLGLDQPFFGLHLELSELVDLPVPYTMEDIAARFVQAMREQQPDGPYYLGGYCGNGIIAYEMARQLLVQNQQVTLLVLFEAYNPAYSEKAPKGARSSMLFQRLRFHLSNLRQMKTEVAALYLLDRLIVAQLKARVRMLRMSYGLRLRMNRGRLQNSKKILNVAADTYRPQPYPGRAVLFRTTKRSMDRYADLKLGWGELVPDLEVYTVPAALSGRREAADNTSMFLEPEVEVLASKMAACLRDASGLEPKTTGLAAAGR